MYPSAALQRRGAALLCWLSCLHSISAGPFPLPTGAGPDRSFAVNASYTSPRCVDKYECQSGSDDVQECSCHPYCWLFDSCCADVRPAHWEQRQLMPGTYRCVAAHSFTAMGLHAFTTNFGRYYSVNVVDTCGPEFRSPLINRLCTHPLKRSGDGTLSSPVTDSVTGVTYRNIFCAGCNGKRKFDIREWTPFYSCNTLAQGVPIDSCPLAFAPPMNVSLHDCFDSYVGHCSDLDVFDAVDVCKDSPTRYVYDTVNRVVYRNWNCTTCNPSPPFATECTSWPREPIFAIEPINRNFPAKILRDYHCPHEPSYFVPNNELAFWSDLCPGTRAY